MMDTTYNVGIYCRLSNDDERDGESVSIENQKLLLQNYVRQRGWNEVDVYIDDGYSGTNFNRPGVRRLIEDAKAKRINVILVKDLSRFGRNYIEFGQYTDYLFPSLGCRFIALNNGIDTMSDNGSTDVMCFLNLFNEFYSRDTSKKVKAVKRACAENGKFMGTYPAYGYRRDPLDKHHLVIDEETAPVVRRIFEMRASGMGFHAIAVALNEEGIQPPGVLYYQRKGQSDPRRVNHKWADQTVKNMVRNEVYIGNMVQGKSGTLSYKSRKLVNKSEDEWIRVEGTHEAIISRELWDTVASIGKKKVRKSAPSDGCKSIFTGLVYCADCGFKMRNHIEKFTYKDGRPGRYSSFICGNYSRSGRGACTIHTIYETVLTQLVLEDIREKARFAEYDPDRLMGEILRLKEKESHTRLFSYEQELKSSLARISDLERLMQNLYEDKCTGSIPQTVFQTLMQKYEAERAEKAEAVPEHEILSKFVMLNGWIEVKTYQDDGYSGGNFQRPGFLEMLEDARHGLINLILVKDLSRLGRDFVEVGRYTDVIFPSLGCRFVSVLDCLDSEGDNTDMLHFRSLMNDYHLKDLSSKVKSVLHAKKKSGQYLAAYAPYGYRKSEEDKHKLVIDGESAAVVRQIFQMRQSGMAYGKIAAALNEKGILPPRWYWAVHYGNGSCKYSRLWAYATVRSLLNDDVYAGTLTQNYTGSRSYKDKTMIRKPESEWISHEGAHEAIIGPELWEAVQKINQAAKQISANNTPPQASLFTGKLVCADCGHPLVAARETQRRKNGTVKHYTSYFCSRFATTGHSICSWHRIFEISLKNLVLSEIRAHGKAVAADEAAVLDKLKQHIQSASAAQQEDYRQEISRLRRRLEELEQITAKLYEDKVSGAISGDSFSVLIQKNEQERIQKSERLDSLLAGERKAQQDIANIHQWAGTIRQYLDLQELNREIIEELIDRIEVGERTIIDGQRHQDIKIYYRFVGLV